MKFFFVETIYIGDFCSQLAEFYDLRNMVMKYLTYEDFRNSLLKLKQTDAIVPVVKRSTQLHTKKEYN